MARFLHLALVAAFLAVALPAAAQERGIRILTGTGEGTPAALAAPLLAEAVGPLLGGARVAVETRAGAQDAAAEVAGAAPDGDTVLACAMRPMAITPQLIGAQPSLDPGEALQPVATIAYRAYGLVVAAGAPWRSLGELLNTARRRPGQVTFASTGTGSLTHLGGELLQQRTGARLRHLAYEDAGAALADVLAGRTDFMVAPMAEVAPQVESGALRLLVIGDSRGSSAFPEVPPASRMIPGLELADWVAICGPRAMPGEAVQRWEDAIRQALAEPALARRLAERGLTPRFEDSATLTARLEADRQQWREVIQAVGLRAE
jgi:tripartite-type tricarboxylate transporter receptor subunit TctC